MIWRLSFWGRRTSIKQGVMPEIVVSGMIFLMLGVSAVDAKESTCVSWGALCALIRATKMLAPGGLETI